MTAHNLFYKHFGNAKVVDMTHSSVKSFLLDIGELNPYESKKLHITLDDDNYVQCHQCFSYFILTDKEAEFFERMGKEKKLNEPICSACIKKISDA